MAIISTAAAVYLVLLARLLQIAGSPRRFHRYTAAKTVTSIGFLVVALLAQFIGRGGMGSRFWLLFLAMAFCAAGDLLLGLANNGHGIHSRTFFRGLVCFGAAHLIFCLFYAFQNPPSWRDLLLPCALLAVTMLLSHKGLLRLHKLRVPAFCYCFLVGLMCSMAISAVFPAHGRAQLLCAAGSVLFLISDCIIVFLYFYIRQRSWMRITNLTTYYLGLLLLALSAAY